MAVPSRQEAFQLLWQHNVPGNIIRHSVVVARVASRFGEKLKAAGKNLDLAILDRACVLHDIGKLQAIESGGRHEVIGHDILKRHGYGEIAVIILKHPLHYILDRKLAPKSWEEKLVFYADKLVMHHKVVALGQRLADLERRYPQHRAVIRKAAPLALKLEGEILAACGGR